MFQISAFIAAVEKIPVFCADVGTACPSERHSGPHHLLALLADFLAFFLGQASEKSVKVFVLRIAPVKLHGVAEHQLFLSAGCHVLIACKQYVKGRNIFVSAPLAHRSHKQSARGVVDRQQACARHRRKGNRHHRLGVVGHAMLFVSIRPGPIEDVLAIRMGFKVERASRHQHIRVPQGHKTGRPAGFGAGAAALVQACQILVPHEGCGVVLQGQQPIPCGRVYIQRRMHHARDNRMLNHSCAG